MSRQITRLRATLRARREVSEFDRALREASPSQRQELLAAAQRQGAAGF